MRNHRQQSKKYNRGVTLVEIMVSVILLSVGILGVGSMQIKSLRHLQSSSYHGMASLLANDIADRMRGNSISAQAGDYVHTSAPDSYTDCVNNACTEEQLAGFDIGNWQTDLAAALPSVKGEVEVVAGSTAFLVTIRWDDDRNGSSGTNCPPESSSDLDCFQVTVAP